MFTNTKEVITFASKIGGYIDTTLTDGKVSLVEAMGFAAYLIQVPSMLPKFQALPGELENITNEGKAEIIAWAEQELNLASDKTEKIIESLAGISVHVVGLLQAFRS